MRVKARVGKDGVLRLELPTHLSERDLDVLVVLQPVSGEPVDAMGYPLGYFDETYGSFAGDPIERGEQPPFDERDVME